MAELRCYLDQQVLAQATAEHVIQQAALAIAERSYFSLALAGGSTPQLAYALLGSQACREQIDWSRTYIFWGDERCVLPEDPASNFRMAHREFLAKVPLPAQNIYRMAGEREPHLAAIEYEERLRSFFHRETGTGEQPGAGESTPHQTFDLILLGLGEDGHTASLFPNSPVLSEKQRWVVCLEHRQPPPPLVSRLSVTLPVINASRQVTFIVSGAAKAMLFQRIMQESPSVELPASLVHPVTGRLLWLIDQAAASQLPSN